MSGTYTIRMNLQNRMRLRDLETETTVARRGGGGWGEGTVRELETDVYKLLYLKWITRKDLLYCTENAAQ